MLAMLTETNAQEIIHPENMLDYLESLESGEIELNLTTLQLLIDSINQIPNTKSDRAAMGWVRHTIKASGVLSKIPLRLQATTPEGQLFSHLLSILSTKTDTDEIEVVSKPVIEEFLLDSIITRDVPENEYGILVGILEKAKGSQYEGIVSRLHPCASKFCDSIFTSQDFLTSYHAACLYGLVRGPRYLAGYIYFLETQQHSLSPLQETTLSSVSSALTRLGVDVELVIDEFRSGGRALKFGLVYITMGINSYKYEAERNPHQKEAAYLQIYKFLKSVFSMQFTGLVDSAATDKISPEFVIGLLNYLLEDVIPEGADKAISWAESYRQQLATPQEG
jgi:hypothetical protein